MAVQYSIQKMVSDGTLSTIALGIQYLQRNDIYMRVAGEETPQSGAPSGYTWSFLDNTTLKILPVVPNGVEVVVYRRTDVDAMYNIYSQNAQFDEATIDENNQQLLYIAQEYLEQGLPGAGVDTIEFLRDDGTNTYYRIKRTDGSYSDEFAVPSSGSVTKVLARESLRRSYADYGLNLVDGSFQVGFTLTNANDVALDEMSGKAFHGPAGTYPAGASPSAGVFFDASGALYPLTGELSFNAFSIGRSSLNAAFVDFITECNAKGKTATGNVDGVTLSTPLQINVPYRFSGVLSITGAGRLDFSNEPIETLSVIQSQFTKGATGISSLAGKTGLIHIRTTTKLLQRFQISEIVNYGEVNYIVNGVLRHPLNDDYSAMSGFSVEYVAASGRATQRLKIAVSATNTTGHLLTFSGCNFHVDAELVSANNPAVDSNFMRFNRAHSFSYTPIIQSAMGSPSLVAYDSYLLVVYGADVIKPVVRDKSCWKTIDGTSYRRVKVVGGSIYTMHSHWNGSDVTVVGTECEKAFRFASHISDASYDLDATILNDSGFAGVRADYGFLAGSVSMKGKLHHNGSAGALIDVVHDMHTDPNNTGVVFVMPKSVEYKLRVVGGASGNELSLIETRNNIAATAAIKPWGLLSGSIDYSGFAGTLVLRASITTTAAHTYKVRLKDFVDNGRAIRLELGNQSTSVTIPDNVVMDCELDGVRVSCINGATSRRILVASGRLRIANATLVDYINTTNTFAVPSGCTVDVENSRWEFITGAHWTNSSLLAKYTALNNVTFDGAAIPAPLYTKGGFWVSASRGCKAINLDLDTAYATYYPDSGLLNPTVKKMAPFNPRGQKDNFDNQYVPST